ncbi:winged helix-turn-helix domain-containing protein [Klebsiella aerogenes]|uniref:winged helix-turn-helix domain-containing protein n=1 Tax=Klebsiella aerogenes TaxID=548 RepID=UPI00254AAEB1|nr:winged helix-turn-helix domain-containing protein [Klebsiella aerogenes]EKZ5287278.1 winged helix-turn-helix transcriptional regulator [Klebsiella aerogenes]MDK7100955.1 winged helix-turn-helix domain-containing protein [Klebsiella aerogenes]MDK7645681.1 winged helix-turn-helix domain-containing protein [Klebsiella aerogenes]MDK7850711.1 winged helix-turn-helix domain-containing protein [Klebsiella aerogenes]MDK8314179.1 winged helix-turn-helix domain-containing protein [Klebsiella aerogene
MYHILNEEVVFSPDDGALWLKEKADDKIILTPTLNRLLLCLIENHGKVITREEVFQCVWDRWGKEGSNNSLNQFISQLRKIFNNYGFPEDTITTVPRVGFIFTIQTLQEQVPVHVKKIFNVNIILKVCFMCSTLLVVGMFFKIFTQHTNNLNISPKFTGAIDKCKVYALTEYDDSLSGPLVSNIQRFINKTHFLCSAPGTIFFFLDPKVLAEQSGNLYVSTCRGNVNEFYNCTNRLDSSWREE